MTLLLYDPSVIEVRVMERREVWRVGVRTGPALQDELLQLPLPQLLIQLLHHLPSVLVDVGTKYDQRHAFLLSRKESGRRFVEVLNKYDCMAPCWPQALDLDPQLLKRVGLGLEEFYL